MRAGYEGEEGEIEADGIEIVDLKLTLNIISPDGSIRDASI
jgi:hypothetical protein